MIHTEPAWTVVDTEPDAKNQDASGLFTNNKNESHKTKTMNYEETTNYLFNQLPMFERQGKTGYKEGLATSLALDEHFGHPHRHYATIHVAGTNGKGSVAHSIAAVLQMCGYRVGLYTSPHLVDFRERIKVNGQPVSKDFVIDFVEKERDFYSPLHPSFFEITTAMAFHYFEKAGVDIAVIEVGLGGRLDCTNIITPILSVITNISLDHTQFLGNSLAEIATEKAGIIKQGVPVVIGETTPETRVVFEAKAKEMNAPVIWAEENPGVLGSDFSGNGKVSYQTLCMGQVESHLCGKYQEKNLNTVLKSLRQLVAMGYISDCMESNQEVDCAIEQRQALKMVSELTGLRGRWETLQENPKVVCDTGHNVGAWEYLSKQLESLTCRQLHIVFGMVADKDVDGVLQLLPKKAIYYFTEPDNHRALDHRQLMEKATALGLVGCAFASVEEAYRKALATAKMDDCIFVGGSSYVVAELLKHTN